MNSAKTRDIAIGVGVAAAAGGALFLGTSILKNSLSHSHTCNHNHGDKTHGNTCSHNHDHPEKCCHQHEAHEHQSKCCHQHEGHGHGNHGFAFNFFVKPILSLIHNFGDPQFFDSMSSKLLHAILQMDQKQIVIVDIGAGTGRLGQELISKFSAQKIDQKLKETKIRIICFDPNEKSLKEAEKKFEKLLASNPNLKNNFEIEFVQGFAEKLRKIANIGDNSVDIVTSTLAVHHIGDSEKQNAMNEIFAVLKNDGKVIIGDFYTDHGKHPLASQLNPHIYANAKIQDMMKNSGFEEIKTEFLNNMMLIVPTYAFTAEKKNKE